MNQQALYMLKRQYGAPVSIYQNDATTTDTITGSKTVSTTVYPVDFAIAMPAKMSRNDKRGISLISANKSLVQGGFYDSTQQRFIVDRTDLPDGLMLTENDWLVYEKRKYQFVSIDEFPTAWVLTAKAVVGEVPQQIFLVQADNLVSFSHGAES